MKPHLAFTLDIFCGAVIRKRSVFPNFGCFILRVFLTWFLRCLTYGGSVGVAMAISHVEVHPDPAKALSDGPQHYRLLSLWNW